MTRNDLFIALEKAGPIGGKPKLGAASEAIIAEKRKSQHMILSDHWTCELVSEPTAVYQA